MRAKAGLRHCVAANSDAKCWQLSIGDKMVRYLLFHFLLPGRAFRDFVSDARIDQSDPD